MSKSKKQKRHYLDEGNQVNIMRGIRKPMPPPGRIIDDDKNDKWDWRQELNKLDEEKDNEI